MTIPLPTVARSPAGSSIDTRSSDRRFRIARWVLIVSALLGGLHLLVASSHFVVRLARGSPIKVFDGVHNFAVVNDVVWRGSAPSPDGYTALADAGVDTIIDLRAEADAGTARELAVDAGLSWIHIPIRDGQPPTTAQIAKITATMESATGPVFVHCQAGVGRTGSVIAALSVSDSHSPRAALIETLRFGPMSLEQQVFVLRSQPEWAATSLLPIAVVSRIIDSPRRAWSRLTGWLAR